MAFPLRKTGLTTGRARNLDFPWLQKARECISATKAHVDILCAHIRYAVRTIAGPVPRITWHHVGNMHFLSLYRNVLLVPASRSWELERGHLFPFLHVTSLWIKFWCERAMCKEHTVVGAIKFTEPWNCWGWAGPLHVIWPTSHAQAGPPGPNCPGPFPDSFWKLTTYVSAWWPLGCSVCAHGLWSSHWAPTGRAQLCPLGTLPSGE